MTKREVIREGIIKSLDEAIQFCKKTGEPFSKEVKTEYTGYDNITYEARATLEIEPYGDWQVSEYYYYDQTKEEWIDTQERNEMNVQTINNIFFEDHPPWLRGEGKIMKDKINKSSVMKRAYELFKNNEAGWTFADALHTAWLEAKGIEEEW